MDNKVIATIQLAKGRVGFYDELSRIHLSLGAPTAYVHSGTNCARLRRAVKDGVIRLVHGSLGDNVPPFKIVEVDGKLKLASNLAEEMKPVVSDEVAESAADKAKDAEVKPEEKEKEEESPAATVEEPAAEEPVEEEKPKKKTTRKKAAKKTEE